jgi:uncharacterized protein YkwD
VTWLTLLKLARSPLVWVAILIASNAATWGLWRHAANGAAARVAAADVACQEAANSRTEALLQIALDQASAVLSAYKEATARAAEREARAVAEANTWRKKYDAAKNLPACAAWAQAVVECPVQ